MIAKLERTQSNAQQNKDRETPTGFVVVTFPPPPQLCFYTPCDLFLLWVYFFHIVHPPFHPSIYNMLFPEYLDGILSNLV